MLDNQHQMLSFIYGGLYDMMVGDIIGLAKEISKGRKRLRRINVGAYFGLIICQTTKEEISLGNMSWINYRKRGYKSILFKKCKDKKLS